jgi:hypothetical protein
MSRLDYGNGYRAGMQKMQDLTQAGIDEMEEALFDMVALFSADDILLKGTDLHTALYAARAALQTRRIEAIQRSTKRNKQMTRLEELEAVRDAARADARAAVDATYDAARADARAAVDAVYDAARADDWAPFQAELKRTQEGNTND